MLSCVLWMLLGAPPQEVEPQPQPQPQPQLQRQTQPQPEPRCAQVDFVNPAPIERTGVVCASVPFGPGVLPAAPTVQVFAVTVTIADAPVEAPAVPLMRWPDGSIAVLQIHATCTIPASGRVVAAVEPLRGPEGRARPFEVSAAPPAAPLLASGDLPLWTELIDPWGRVLRAGLVPDPAAGPDGIVFDSGAVRLRRYRAPHRLVATGDAAALGADALLDLTGWLLTFAGERRGELTLVLDNREPTAGPLGPVRLRGFRLLTGDDRLRFLPAFASENLLPEPRPRLGGGYHQWLLRPGDANYLGDGTAKAFRLHLFEDAPGVADEVRAQAIWATARMIGFCDVGSVRRSGAFGGHGGPAPLVEGDLGDAGRQVTLWRRIARFGPFAGFGDPEDGALTGAPRHGDSLLHNVLRWQSPQLLATSEAMVLQHGLRPDGGRAPRQPDVTEAYRQGLGGLARAFPHGFTPIDYEHVSAHLLFDHYWLTGDPWARDELARLARSIDRLLDRVPFRTSRGEGNCLEAGVMCARATGDTALLTRLAAHAREAVLPRLVQLDGGVAIAQPPHEEVLDGRSRFDAPWQMAQLVRGLAAVGAATADQELRDAAVRVAVAMGRAGWVAGTGPKTFLSAVDSGRYTLAASSSDYVGGVRMTIGAFELAAELAGDPDTAAFLRARADFVLGRMLPPDATLPERTSAGANPWLQVVMDRRERRGAN